VKVSAIFEGWHIGDGNYPPLRQSELVNLSFEPVPDRVTRVSASEPENMVQISGAEYQFCAKVLKVYGGDPPLTVVEAEGFRFHICRFPEKPKHFEEGDKIWGIGSLSLDCYLWVEFLHKYVDAPDLFYKLRITGIYESPEQKQVESMAQSRAADWLVKFDSDGVDAEPIPKTFKSHRSKDRRL
jgi:hypothetical protein